MGLSKHEKGKQGVKEAEKGLSSRVAVQFV
jgi:hypothetical protein